MEGAKPTAIRRIRAIERAAAGRFGDDGDPPPPEVLEPIMRDLDALEREMKALFHAIRADLQRSRHALTLA